ncbi:hypothetical protein EDB82DRAFT_516325 [Fusarium venenatum]|uniref:uncharacterized protein n=1 Tax=Fusarium venenatum TaxID=56646 RepID=UPI001D8ADF81|nr:hypothetical protein EDB82DRAFT_516325 [Fusarium venenatum]
MYSHGLGEPRQQIADWTMGLVIMTQHISVNCLAGMQKPVVSLWAFITVQWATFTWYGKTYAWLRPGQV